MSDARLIDVDVVAERASMPRILPYLSAGWREYLSTGGSFSTAGPRTGGYSLPGPAYRPPVATATDSGVGRVRERLDRDAVELAVLEPGIATAVSGLANIVMAGEILRGANDWLAAEVLDADDRFRGSILVSGRDGIGAAEEVRRLAADPRMAQVVLAFPPCLLGDRSLHPLFAAAAELGLPVSLQAGGGYVGANPGPTPTGFPTTWGEYRIDGAYSGIPHLVSMVVEGVFEQFPSLRLFLSGFGVTWLPSVLARLETMFDAGLVDPRKGLNRRPTDVVREHVKFTTRDLDARSADELLQLLSAEDVERLLVYGSGYPEGEVTLDLDALPERARAAVTHGNAASTLRLTGLPAATAAPQPG